MATSFVSQLSTQLSTQMQQLPPGVAYLVRIAPQISLPPLYAAAACYLARIALDISVPFPLVILACIISWPAAFAASIQLERRRVVKEAEEAGAVLPPLVESHRFAGRDLVDLMIRDQENKFLGASHAYFQR